MGDALPAAYPALPVPLVAMVAVVHGDTLVVEGGSLLEAHVPNSRSALNANRYTLDLTDPAAEWQPSEMDWPMQQGSLVSYGGQLYQTGGMAWTNDDGEEIHIISRPALRRWDDATDGWVDLPSMPSEFGRSSHAHALIGSTLYLTGGWALTGASGSGMYLESMLHIDLADPDAGWTETPVDFTIRDHCAAALDGRIWVIGGMTVETMWPATPRIFDPETGTWSEGPELPTVAPINGFGCSAAVHDGRLYVNVADGKIVRLTEDGAAWEDFTRPNPGRIFGAMVVHRDRLLLLGGGIGRNVTPQDTFEVFPVGD